MNTDHLPTHVLVHNPKQYIPVRKYKRSEARRGHKDYTYHPTRLMVEYGSHGRRVYARSNDPKQLFVKHFGQWCPLTRDTGE